MLKLWIAQLKSISLIIKQDLDKTYIRLLSKFL